MSVSPPKIRIINLGCARNLVDAQAMAGRLKNKGYALTEKGGGTVIVNTCCFIEEARKESVDTILDVLELKKKGKIGRVILAGCLVQRYRDTLVREFRDADALVGVPSLAEAPDPGTVRFTPSHTAYVKICEGCYNRCSFCVIPKIKGPLSSRAIASVVEEVKALDDRGVKEINLIGQDITAYGLDRNRREALPRLLKEILRHTRRIRWIRLLYMFPSRVTDELIDLIAGEERICKYVDIPFQHISDLVLKAMGRKMTAAGIRRLVGKIRTKIPSAAFRTSFIVGFPGETDRDFRDLVRFVKDVRFEKMGAFMYSREEGTAAYRMTPQVSRTVKRKRYDTLMSEQRRISREIQEGFIGRRLKVLIDEKAKEQDNIYLGRTEYDAPEVDGLVYVHASKRVRAGDLIDVTITDSHEYDLIGETA